jgi:hypothetical protein
MLLNLYFREGGGRVCMVFQLEFSSLVHLVQKLTSYEQRHLELYQNRFKRQVTLIDAEDAEDCGDDQEVAVAEWTRGGGGGGQNPCPVNGGSTKDMQRGFK